MNNKIIDNIMDDSKKLLQIFSKELQLSIKGHEFLYYHDLLRDRLSIRVYNKETNILIGEYEFKYDSTINDFRWFKTSGYYHPCDHWNNKELFRVEKDTKKLNGVIKKIKKLIQEHFLCL